MAPFEAVPDTAFSLLVSAGSPFALARRESGGCWVCCEAAVSWLKYCHIGSG